VRVESGRVGTGRGVGSDSGPRGRSPFVCRRVPNDRGDASHPGRTATPRPPTLGADATATSTPPTFGTFEFSPLLPGKYRVEIQSYGFETMRREVVIGGASVDLKIDAIPASR